MKKQGWKKEKNIYLLVSIIFVIVVLVLIFAGTFLSEDFLKSPSFTANRVGSLGNVGRVPLCDLSCGDGCLKPHEECDDGNSQNGDGCSSTCEIEQDFGCYGNPSVCVPLSECLNDVQDAHETDVDCGGEICGACRYDRQCDLDTDCISNFCDNGVCAYPSTTVELPCKQIQYASGYIEDHVNVVFIGDDYDHATEYQTNDNDFGYTKFLDEVDHISSYFLNVEPFTNAENINLFYVDDINTDLECIHVSISGNSDCSSPHSGSWSSNDCRVISCSSTKSFNLASACPNLGTNTPNEEVIVLFNSDYHGGTGGSFSKVTHYPASVGIATHEFGHSFGGLADEYTYGGGAVVEPGAYNCNLDPLCPKWSDLIGNPNIPDNIGCFNYYTNFNGGTGCKYNNEIHRGTGEQIDQNTYSLSSLMQTSGNSFRNINQRIISCRLAADTTKFPTYSNLFRDASMMDLDVFCSLIPFGTEPPGQTPPGTEEGYKFLQGATKFTFERNALGEIELRDYERKHSAIYPDPSFKQSGDLEFKFDFNGQKVSVFKDDFVWAHAPFSKETPSPIQFKDDVSRWEIIVSGNPINLNKISYVEGSATKIIDISAVPQILMSSSGNCANCQTKCGDGEIQVPNEAGLDEDCEGNDLNGQTCQSLGFPSGTLACSGCQFDTSGCQALTCAPHTDNGDGTCTAEFLVSEDGHVRNIGYPSWNYIHDATQGIDVDESNSKIYLETWSINDAYARVQRGFMQFPYDLPPAANFISAELEARVHTKSSVTFQDSELYVLVGTQDHPLTNESYFGTCGSTTQAVSSPDILGIFPFSGITIGITPNIFTLDTALLDSAITPSGDALKICFRTDADALDNSLLTEYPNPDIRIYTKDYYNGAILRIIYDFI
ncbi:hypothetical protein HN604_01970 [archaeon]|jgi:cysteine-rich repeat protein|nr:hypothetical protein [archaeon]MBT6182362.1 hypothetical protein [archaeon]MBT6606473.1 hypothetical protein [archaeon]MBT7251362.1 hypothetical protein [archaeon]MBT7660829.1 hypothetical protein [archaeon]